MELTHETVFRPRPRELIREAFLRDQRRYFSRESDSCVEEFFHLFFVDFICGLYPVVEKTNGLRRRLVLQSLVKCYPLLNEDLAARWAPALTAAEPAQTLGEELAVFFGDHAGELLRGYPRPEAILLATRGADDRSGFASLSFTRRLLGRSS